MKLLSSVGVLAAVMAGGAEAWWDVSHGVSGAVAFLLMKDPSARQNLNNILTYLPTIANDINGGNNWPVGNFGSNVPNDLRPPQNSINLANAAIWPDVVKGFYNVKAFDNWHYQNQLYDPNNYGTCSVDGLDAGQLMQVFNDMIVFGGMYNGRTTAHWYQGFSVNMVSHLFGDIMMPFHMMAYCFPDGTTDAGGNKWSLTLNDGKSNTVKNMHALWDSVANTWANDIQSQIIMEDGDYVKLATALLQTPELNLEAINGQQYGWDFKNGNPGQPVFYNVDLAMDAQGVFNKETKFRARLQQWAEESYNIAAEAYHRFPQGTVVQAGSEDFKWLVETSQKRVMLAGYRMAAVFDEWLSTKFIGIDTPVFSQISQGYGEPALNIWNPPANEALYQDMQTGHVYRYDRLSGGANGQWVAHSAHAPTASNSPNHDNLCAALQVSSKLDASSCGALPQNTICTVKCVATGAESNFHCQRAGNGNKLQWVGTAPECHLGARRRSVARAI